MIDIYPFPELKSQTEIDFESRKEFTLWARFLRWIQR